MKKKPFVMPELNPRHDRELTEYELRMLVNGGRKKSDGAGGGAAAGGSPVSYGGEKKSGGLISSVVSFFTGGKNDKGGTSSSSKHSSSASGGTASNATSAFCSDTGRQKGETVQGTATVHSGDTLSKITRDYNREHGTSYTVQEVAATSGISNPDLIHPGQTITFGSGKAAPPAAESHAQPTPPKAGSTGSTGNTGRSSSAGTSPSSKVEPRQDEQEPAALTFPVKASDGHATTGVEYSDGTFTSPNQDTASLSAPVAVAQVPPVLGAGPGGGAVKVKDIEVSLADNPNLQKSFDYIIESLKNVENSNGRFKIAGYDFYLHSMADNKNTITSVGFASNSVCSPVVAWISSPYSAYVPILASSEEKAEIQQNLGRQSKPFFSSPFVGFEFKF